MIDSCQAVAWMQNISAQKAHAESDKWTKSLGVSLLLLRSTKSRCSTESQKVEELLLPGWISIINLLMAVALVLQKPGRATWEESAVVGTVDQTSVEQQGLQTQTQPGDWKKSLVGFKESVKERGIIRIRFKADLGWNNWSIFYIQVGWIQLSPSEWWRRSWASLAAKIWWWVATLQSLSTPSPLHAKLW